MLQHQRKRPMLPLVFFLCAITLRMGSTNAQDPFQIEAISSTQLFGRDFVGLRIDAIIDVRTAAEFAQGHVPGAMLVDSLAAFGTATQVAGPSLLAGCEYCDIAAYCTSGNRAAQALRVLQQAGFKGRLYNAGGITQWLDNNYPVNTSPSFAAPCTTNPQVGQQCMANYNARAASGDTMTTTTTPQQQQFTPQPPPGDAGVVRVNFFDWNNPESNPIFEASGTEDGTTTTTFPEVIPQEPVPVPAPFTAGTPAASGPVTNSRPVPVVQWGTAQWTDPSGPATETPQQQQQVGTPGDGTTGVATTPNNGNRADSTFWNGLVGWGSGGNSQPGQQQPPPMETTPMTPQPGDSFVDRWSGNRWIATPGGFATNAGTGGGTGTGAGGFAANAGTGAGTGAGGFDTNAGTGAGGFVPAGTGMTGTEPMFEETSSTGGGGAFQGFSFVRNDPAPPVDTTSTASATSGGAPSWFSAFSFARAPPDENDNIPTGFATPVRGGASSWNNPSSSWSSSSSAAASTEGDPTQVQDTWGNGKVVWLDSLESGAGIRTTFLLAVPLLVLLL